MSDFNKKHLDFYQADHTINKLLNLPNKLLTQPTNCSHGQ